MLDGDATLNGLIHFYEKRIDDFEVRTVRMTPSF